MNPLTESQSKHIRELLRSAAIRRDSGEFVIEGPHLLEAAIEKATAQIEYAAFTLEASSRYPELMRQCDLHKLPLYSIPAKLASRVADTEESQGIFAVMRMPAQSLTIQSDIVLALNGVQDPGNVGTIIRAAAWFGVKTILLGEGTADPYAPKVIRSTQGSIFDIVLETKAELTSRVRHLKGRGYRSFAATLDEDATSLYEMPLPEKALLLLGSEAHGLNSELSKLADEKIIIPRYGSGESLNVAMSAAIVLAEFRRRSGQNMLPP